MRTRDISEQFLWGSSILFSPILYEVRRKGLNEPNLANVCMLYKAIINRSYAPREQTTSDCILSFLLGF